MRLVLWHNVPSCSLITDKRSRGASLLYRRESGAKQRCARPHLPVSWIRCPPPALVVVGSCQRGLWFHMTSDGHKSGPWFLRSPPRSSRSSSLCNVTSLTAVLRERRDLRSHHRTREPENRITTITMETLSKETKDDLTHFNKKWSHRNKLRVKERQTRLQLTK